MNTDKLIIIRQSALHCNNISAVTGSWQPQQFHYYPPTDHSNLLKQILMVNSAAVMRKASQLQDLLPAEELHKNLLVTYWLT